MCCIARACGVAAPQRRGHGRAAFSHASGRAANSKAELVLGSKQTAVVSIAYVTDCEAQG